MLRKSYKSKKVIHQFLQTQGICVILFAVWLLPAASPAADSIAALGQIGRTFARLAEDASPAVVRIETDRVPAPIVPKGYSQLSSEPFRHYEQGLYYYHFNPYHPGPSFPQPVNLQRAYGCGFIVSPNGYILTNNHVVAAAERVTVRLADGRSVRVKIVGTDPETDIAVLKINAGTLPFLELGNSDALEVGDWVVALGSPLCRGNPFSPGMVTAKDKEGLGLASYEDFIQTDAAITPGDGGGPLLNLHGRVAGINTAIAVDTRPARISYAIPINIAKVIYEQLVEYGTIRRGFLGVKIKDLSPDEAETLGLKKAKGVLVTEVIDCSAASKVGLLPGDVIVKFNHKSIISANNLRSNIALLRPGTLVGVSVLRKGVRCNFIFNLGMGPPSKPLAERPTVLDRLGISVQDLTDELVEHLGYGYETGVVVTEVEPCSQADRAGITVGTLILQVNRTPIRDIPQLIDEIDWAFSRGTALLLIRDEHQSRFVPLRLTPK